MNNGSKIKPANLRTSGDDAAQAQRRLQAEIAGLRERLALAEGTLRAIRAGEVDRAAAAGLDGDRPVRLNGSDHLYRVLVETMHDGAVALLPDGAIAYSNNRFAQIVRTPLEQVVGASLGKFLAAGQEPALAALLAQSATAPGGDLILAASDGPLVPVQFAASPLRIGGLRGVGLIVHDVTERKRTEEALRRASGYHRSLIEASLDPLAMIAPDGKITDVNQATETATGLARGELIGTDFCRYFTNSGKARAGYQQVFQDGSVQNYGLEIQHRDGHTTPVLYNASVYRDEAGQVAGVFAAARDITERRRAEFTLRWLGWIVESSDDAIVGKTPDGRILTWNRGAERLYGYAAAEIVGQPLSRIVPPEALEQFQQINARLQRDEHIEHQETVRMCKDGRRILISLTISPVKDADGAIVGASAISRDITAQKWAERELRASEARFHVFMRHSPMLAFINDEAGRIVYVNNGAGHAEDIAAQLRADARVLESGEPSRTIEEVIGADGQVRQMLCFRFVFNDAAGRRLLGGVSVDITEQKAAEKALSEALATKDMLVREVHHRVKNNLQTISSLMHMQAGLVPDIAARHALRDAQRRVDSMALIHEQVNGRNDIRESDFGEYVKRLVGDLFESFGIDPARVRARFDLDPVPLALDQMIPCGLILNELITNSLKYAFPGQRTGEILVSLRCADGCTVTMTIADDGVGLPPANDGERAESLGTRIVEILTRQLAGRLLRESAGGVSTAVTFTRSAQVLIN